MRNLSVIQTVKKKMMMRFSSVSSQPKRNPRWSSFGAKHNSSFLTSETCCQRVRMRVWSDPLLDQKSGLRHLGQLVKESHRLSMHKVVQICGIIITPRTTCMSARFIPWLSCPWKHLAERTSIRHSSRNRSR